LKHGKIVEIVDDFSVLMSHAGGFHNCVLQNSDFFNKIMYKKDVLSDDENGSLIEKHFKNINIQKYFTKMNSYRIELCNCSESKKLLGITESVNLHNGFYSTFIDSFFDASLNVNPVGTPSNEYFLLQAMALKPDPNKEFASYIISCGGGCGITIPPKDNYSKYLTSVKNGGLRAIAHGHVPICMPHPLIFKRKISKPEESKSEESKSEEVIVFIENDTSNGIRPKRGDGSLKELPLSYINLNNNDTSYGVGILDENGIIQNMPDLKYDVNGNPDGETYDINGKPDGKTYDDNVKLGLYGPIMSGTESMPGTESVQTMYFDTEIISKIKNSGNWPNVIKWNNYENQKPITGGKRRTKKNKFSRKYKKRIGKRTKKNHPKKHTCRRCH